MNGFKRPLLVGASGQVGTAIHRALEERGGAECVLRSSRQSRPGWVTLDLAALAQNPGLASGLGEASPDAVLCVGGMTFVDGCERAPEEAMRANALGPAVLAEFAWKRRAPFVFFSTDYVFSGAADEPGPYTEDSPTHPLSVYGRSKLAGEEAVLAAHPAALIVRTTVVYGPDAAGKNFLYTLLRHLWTGLPLRIPDDQVSTPTYNRDLAQAVLSLLDARISGVVHVAGPEVMDRMQFAREVAGYFKLDATGVEGVSTASLSQVAARPLASGLATARLQELVPGLRRHTVGEALQDAEAELREFLSTLPQPAFG